MKVLKLPSYEQTYGYDCGAKAVQSILAYYGFDVKEEKIMKAVGTNKNGTPAKKIIRYLRKRGLRCEAKQGMSIAELKKAINEGDPVLIVLQAWSTKKISNWEKTNSEGHYVIAVGYDSERIIFEDPYISGKSYLKFDELLDRWHDRIQDIGHTHNFGIITHGKNHSKNLGKIVHMD